MALLLSAGLAQPVRAAAPPDAAVALLLQQLAAHPAADTVRVRILSSLCYSLHDSDPTSALRYGEKAVNLATQLQAKRSLLHSLLNLSSCYANLADGPHALLLQQQALTLARTLRDQNGIVRAYTGIGGVHHERGDTTNAFRNYHRALLRVHEQGVSVRTRVMLLGNLGNLYAYVQNYPKALLYTRRALQLARTSHDRAGESLYMANLGLYYMQQNQLGIAEGLLRNAIGLVEPLKNYRFEVGHRELLATVLIMKGELDEAEELTQQSLRLARQIDYKERVLDAYNLLSEISEQHKEYEDAFRWQRMFQDLNDSLNSRSRLQTLAALQTGYETTEKEHQIRLLTQRGELQQLRNRELWAIVAALVLGLGGMGFLYMQLRRSRTDLSAKNLALQQATQELREVAASKDRLYAIVAHDLRGPVTSFVGVTELIDFYLKQGDENGLRRLPALVRQSAQSLNGLLDNLLSWAVSQTGELVSRPESLVVDELFNEIEELYRTTAQAKQIQLTASAPLDLPLWADRNMARTILRNLVGNALKFTPRGGQIELSAQASPTGEISLTVTDTGQGMQPDQVANLLRPGTPRLTASSLGSARSGTGLGLPICRAFAERLGGTLSIESSSSEGTVVRVQLPGAQKSN